MKKTFTLVCTLICIHTMKAQWVEVASGLTDDICFQDIDAVDATTAWAAASSYFTVGGEMLAFTRTIDGETWIPGIIDHADAAGCTLSNISARSGTDAWVAMFNYAGGGGIFHTTDGGTSWEHQTTAEFVAPSGFPNVVHMFDLNNGFCMGDPNGGYFEIYTTTDGGDVWSRVPEANIPAAVTDEFGIVDNYSVIGETIWFGTNMGNIYKSEDMGFTWAKYASSLSYTTDIAFSDPDHGICLSLDGFTVTEDGGETWIDQDYEGDPRFFCLANIPGTSIIVSAEHDDAAYWFNDGSSYTIDNGLTWFELDDEIPMHALSFISSSIGWAGGCNGSDPETGIYKLNIDLSVGISELTTTENTISIYPNPASDVLHINLMKNGSSIIQVTDLFGKILYDGVVNSTQNEIDISPLASGLYLLTSNRNGLMQTETFVKK